MHNLTSGELARAVWRRRGWFLVPVFIALAAFQPTLVNTWQGVAGIPRGYRELAEVLCLRWLDFARLIAIPGALPQIFTGLHAALIYAWTATIGAELLLNVAPGLGGRMNEGQHLFQMDVLLLCVLAAKESCCTPSLPAISIVVGVVAMPEAANVIVPTFALPVTCTVLSTISTLDWSHLRHRSPWKSRPRRSHQTQLCGTRCS